MKKLREEFRRIGAICLTAVMLVTQTPVMAFAAEEVADENLTTNVYHIREADVTA